MNPLSDLWVRLVDVTTERFAAPVLSLPYFSDCAISAHEFAESLIVAVIQILVIALVFRPLESRLPAEKWADRRLTQVDCHYTLIVVLGVLPTSIFLAMTPLRVLFGGGVQSGGLRDVPLLNEYPLLLFCAYYLAFDFVYYWLHRAEHAIPWWWALHSLHHSQRQVSCWSNHRDCFLSGLLEALVLASVGLVLGVDPAEFALLMLLGELIQDFSHANVRIGFGRFLDKAIVGPAYHRLHHMQMDPARAGLHRCNFAQAFPIWDILFGTALYGEAARPTGVTDPAVDADNRFGLIGQQRAALRRFWGAIRRRSGWRPGDVSFGAGYEPVADRPPAESR